MVHLKQLDLHRGLAQNRHLQKTPFHGAISKPSVLTNTLSSHYEVVVPVWFADERLAFIFRIVRAIFVCQKIIECAERQIVDRGSDSAPFPDDI